MEYDFGARWYDPIIGRWGTLDPMAENNYSNTPYKYSNNNPENYIDPDGREETNENGNTPIGWDKYGQPIYDPATYYNPGYPNGMSSYYAPDYTSDSYTPQPVNDNNLPQITVTPDWGSYLGYQLNKLNDSGTDLSAAQERAANYGNSFLPFIVGATESVYNMGVDTNPNASSGTKGTGMGLKILSTSLDGYNVYKQYKKGGVKNINPVDATSVAATLLGWTSQAISFLGFGGVLTSLIGDAAGKIAYPIATYQSWNDVYKLMDNLRYAPSYIDPNGEPVYGNPSSIDN